MHQNLRSEALADLKELISNSRQRIAQSINCELAMTYWRVGKRLLVENLNEGRGEYGRKVLDSLSRELVNEYGNGFSYAALTRMVRFAEFFPDEQIVVTLSQQLSWSHFVAILPVKAPLAREFYAELCRVERWSVRTLRQKIGGLLFERTALSKQSDDLIRTELATLRDEGRMTPELVFRDPYLLDFLGLSGSYSESELEAAIVREIETFLLELGSGFCFVARQKRISVGRDDFYLDLLFYHRRLRRLVAIDLKLESFQPTHTGQMELYLRWLDRHERVSGEEAPIGLILCAGADAEQVELMQLDEKSIRVAEYLTELPPLEILRDRLHRAITIAREQATSALPPPDEGRSQ